MPSCTTPMSSKISVIESAIWRDMLVSCSVSGSTIAMAPTWIAPCCHSTSASAPAPAMRSALRRCSTVAEDRHQALRRQEQAGVPVDRVADIFVLVERAREQLHGEDVGVAVD